MPVVDSSGFINVNIQTWSKGAVPSNTIQGDVGATGVVDIDFVDLVLEQHIVPSNKASVLTGVYDRDVAADGWVWDKRILQSDTLLNTRHNSFIGGHETGLRDGIPRTWWQSGVVENIRLDHIGTQVQKLSRTYTPVVETGVYSMHWDTKPLFSDFSVSGVFDVGNVDNGVMYYDLPSDAVFDTINVSLFYRDDDFRIWNYFKFVEVVEFTGELSTLDSPRATTDINGVIQWGNLSQRDYEFLIDSDNRLHLNNEYYLIVGSDTLDGGFSVGTLDAVFIEKYWEPKGPGQLQGRDLYLDFFPVNEGSLVVVSIDNSGTITEWEEVNTLSDLAPGGVTTTEQGYVVDYDLGIVTMSGYQAPDLLLAADIGASTTTIEVHPDLDLSGWPSEGLLLIGSERILFKQREGFSFLNVVRGYDGTTAAIHITGDVVEHVPQGIGTTDNLYVAYYAVPRIEFETGDNRLRTANSNGFVDIKPSANVKTNNILEILSVNTNVASIVLETDSAVISGNLFGPVLYGTDLSNLTATVLDSRGGVVPGIEVQFEILDGPGGLNGPLGTTTTVTNTEGEAHAIYNAPYDINDIEFVVDVVTHSGSDTIFTVNNFPTDLSADDVWVFQIHKHDKFFGSVGLKRTILDSGGSTTPYGSMYLDLDGLIGEEYLDAQIQILRTDMVLQDGIVVHLEDLVDGSGITYTRVWVDFAISSALIANQPCWLLESDAVKWNPSALNGVRNILYEYDATAIHPLDASVGAYVPLHPDGVSTGSLTFSGRNLPIPDADDRDSNLGAYVLVAPSNVSIIATATDPVSGRIIQSNVIRLRLQLPQSMIGVDTSGALPIPYGWNLITSSFNVGTALGGANFITINNLAENINQFTIAGLL